LTQALGLLGEESSAAGDVVYLATSGSSAHYVGNFDFVAAGTSSSGVVSIEPAEGVANLILDGNGGSSSGCDTSACDGPVLSIGADVYAAISGVTIENADNTTTNGGGISTGAGTDLTVSDSTFSGNAASNGNGGAIESGDDGTGTLTVSHSTFSDDTAGWGGAIDSGDDGTGTLAVTDSTFSDDTASNNGGAIDSGDDGTGTLAVTDSTFSGDTASNNAGAIDSGDDGGTGNASVSGSSFSDNTTRGNDAGAIDSDSGGTGTLTVTDSSFSDNTASNNAGAIDSGDYAGTDNASVSDSTFSDNTARSDAGAIDSDSGGTGTLTVSDSTFSDNSAPSDGGAIDNDDYAGTGILSVTSSTFSGNTANDGGAIDSGDGSGNGTTTVAADLFTSSCNQNGSTWTDDGYNVGSDGSCFSGTVATGDVSSSMVSSGLGPLQDNGGPTETMALLAGTPAIGNIPNDTTVRVDSSNLTLCPTTDQRGVESVSGAACDSGAVQLVATSLNVSATPSIQSYGNSVQLSASVMPSGATGTVTFTNTTTATVLCGPVTASAGAASCSTSNSLVPDIYPVTATYSGDSNYVGSTATTSFTVAAPSGRTPTSVALSSSANPSQVGTQVTYTATVSPTPDGGTVGFTDSGSAISGCESVSLSSGSATCEVTYSSGGTHGIEVNYSGDATFAPSSSGALSQVVKPGVVRVYGEDAIATAIAVSQAQFQAKGSAKAVVLARSDFFSDVLAGGPLAAELDAPLLITPGAPLSSSLDPRVLTEIQRALPPGRTVYVLGGDLALSPQIDTTLEGLGYNVVREAGVDEYATAVDIAEALGDPSTIFEATGTSFYDSESAVPAAIETNGAILLTDGFTQAPETAAYLAAHPADARYAIGGPLAAAGADPTATAIYGQDLYGTAEAVAQRFFPHPTTFGSATSASFSDALVAGPVLGSEGAPMLLVPPSGALPSPISRYLSSVASGLVGGTLYGGPLAVGDDVLGELNSLI
jgi:hypothetical protein